MQYVIIKNDTAILSINGVFNFGRCKTVKSELDTSFQNGCTKVIVDFVGTKFIDSAAIRMLCDIRENVHADNFSVRNAAGKVLTTLRSSGLEGWIKN